MTTMAKLNPGAETKPLYQAQIDWYHQIVIYLLKRSTHTPLPEAVTDLIRAGSNERRTEYGSPPDGAAIEPDPPVALTAELRGPVT